MKQNNIVLLVAVLLAVTMAGCTPKSGVKRYEIHDENSSMGSGGSGGKIDPLGGVIAIDGNGTVGDMSGKTDEIVVFGGDKDPSMEIVVKELNATGVESLFFAYNSYVIEGAMQSIIQKNRELLSRQMAEGYRIRLEGNCDQVGSDEYNYALGLKRAKVTKEALEILGIAAERIALVSYGESRPACNDTTDTCMAQNRRVDFKIER